MNFKIKIVNFKIKIEMLKYLLVILPVFFVTSFLFGQNTHWSTLEYSYSKGPVSPEYQYNYKIIINENGEGILIYTNSSSTKDYAFTAGKKTLKKINKDLKKCNVFTVNTEEMKSDKHLIGGSNRELRITMWQAPNIDAKPQVIIVPSQLNEKYSACMNRLYDRIENAVPQETWEKARMQ